MSYRDTLRKTLRADEGVRDKPYRDTVGKLTIGCGRNLDDKGLRQDEIALMLENDINDAEADAKAVFSAFESLTDARKVALCSMAFNLGRTRLAGFKRFLAALAAEDYLSAAAEMMASSWSLQVGRRADRLAKMVREG